MAAGVNVSPSRRFPTRARLIGSRGNSLRPVGGFLICGAGTGDPRPFASAKFPEIVERSGLSRRREVKSAEDPEIIAGVHPRHGGLPPARHIRSRRCVLRAVNAVRIDRVRAAHPFPFSATELPEVIEQPGRVIRVVSESTEEPEVPGRIEVPGGAPAAARKISRSGDALVAIDSWFVRASCKLRPLIGRN